MATTLAIPRRSWLWTSLLLVMYTGVFERGLDGVDKRLSTMGVLGYLGLALTPIAFAMGAFLQASSFMRKFPSSTTEGLKRKLADTYVIALAIWSVASFIIRILLAGVNPFRADLVQGFAVLSTIWLAQTVLGCVFAWLVVERQGRWYQRASALKAA